MKHNCGNPAQPHVGITNAGKALGVDPNTLRHWHQTGVITGCKTKGGTFKFATHLLNRLINERAEQLTPAQAIAILGGEARLLARWEQAGYITSTRTYGHHRRYTRASVEAFRRSRLAKSVDSDTAAGLLGVSRETLDTWADEGSIHYYLSDECERYYHPEDIHVVQLRQGKVGKAKGVLRTGDVGAIYRVDNKTVRRWQEEGLLPATHTAGGHLRFLVDDIPEPFRSIPVAQAPITIAQLVERVGITDLDQLDRWIKAHGLTTLSTPNRHRRFLQDEVNAALAA